MNKKIFWIFLFLFISFVNVNAETLEINGESFDLQKDIIGEGYYYDYSNNTLKLDNYDGGPIRKDGILNIVLKGENKIKDNNTLIQASEVTITGDGSITLNGETYGIDADDIDIKNISIYGDIKILFAFENNINITKTTIDIYSRNILIVGGYNINIIDSNIKTEGLWGFRFNALGKAIIKNSNLNFSCLDECLNTKANFSFIKTNALFYGQGAAVRSATLSFQDSTFTVSNDGVNYQSGDVYKNYLYLKITSSITDDDQNDDLDNDQDDNQGDTPDNENNGDSNNNDNNDINSDSNNTNNNNSESTDNNVNDDNIENDNINDDNNLDNNNTSSSDKNDSDKDKNDNNDNVLDNVYTDSEYTNSEYTESEYTDNEYSDVVDITNPKTGDNVIKWLLVFGLSIILLIITGLFIKRNINGKDKTIFFE